MEIMEIRAQKLDQFFFSFPSIQTASGIRGFEVYMRNQVDGIDLF